MALIDHRLLHVMRTRGNRDFLDMVRTCVNVRRVPREDELLSVSEAARRACVSPQTIRMAIRAGRLRGYRVGTKLLKVAPADLVSYIRPARG